MFYKHTNDRITTEAIMDGRFKKGNKVGKQFTSEYQPKNKGRKHKIFTILRKNYGINLKSNGEFTPSQIEDLLQSLLTVDVRQTTALNMSMNEDMKEIIKKIRAGEQPEALGKGEVVAQVFVALSQAINAEMAKGDSATMRWIIEYLFGKATQPIESEVNLNKKDVDLSVLSTEELLQYKEILEKLNNNNGSEE